MKKMILTGLLLVLGLQSQFARADYAEDLLYDIKVFIGANGGNDLLTKLNQLNTAVNTLNSNIGPPETPPSSVATRTTSLAGNKSTGNTAAANAATTGRAAAPTVATKQGSIQTATGSAATRNLASTEMQKTILNSGTTALDASGNTIGVPVGGLSFNWAQCGGAADLGKKDCAEDETHLANKDPNLWKDEASKKQKQQVAVRDQERLHKDALTYCKVEYEKLAANIDPSDSTLPANATVANNCAVAGVNVAGNPADALAVVTFKSKAQAKYNNYTAAVANSVIHQNRVDTRNGEITLAQHQQRIIHLVLAERAATDKSCNILDTKDLSILEPAAETPAAVSATNAVLAPLTTAALVTPLASASGTYSNTYCKCIRFDVAGHCTEGKAVNFASKKINAEVAALDCEIDTITNACKTKSIFMGNDSLGNPVYVNAIVKMTAEQKAAAIAAMTAAEKSAYIKKTRSVAFY